MCIHIIVFSYVVFLIHPCVCILTRNSRQRDHRRHQRNQNFYMTKFFICMIANQLVAIMIIYAIQQACWMKFLACQLNVNTQNLRVRMISNQTRCSNTVRNNLKVRECTSLVYLQVSNFFVQLYQNSVSLCLRLENPPTNDLSVSTTALQPQGFTSTRSSRATSTLQSQLYEDFFALNFSLRVRKIYFSQFDSTSLVWCTSKVLHFTCSLIVLVSIHSVICRFYVFVSLPGAQPISIFVDPHMDRLGIGSVSYTQMTIPTKRIV